MKSMTQRARYVVTFALIGILCFQVPAQSFAQVGQNAMSQPVGVANGVVNRGLGALGSLNDAGPGFFYYGVNGAGRGLGYFGSYMTLGGFIPYAQDELGGFWSADLRTHLSTNGGFFSNVGVIRKQLTDSGSLLGFGVYWDYDGDMNQYSGTGDSIYGQFGHMYQQIGVSGEYVTDRGAIRSNGYMPVGTTAYSVGAPGDLFTQHHHLCAYGLDAALGGADLEVGAWIPKLEAFGGMISVGGYTFGNANEWNSGTETGERMVPFFGGVYTRFDITVANNWDINLQYNNDPFFDSTGFARLTYRMGGSRRRNVPDQLEQPLMRNEHIVRGHQTPLVCGNTTTGQPWKFIHVDNTAAPGGDGTAEAPFTNLADAQTAAQQEWDIVYVHEGNSTATTAPPNFYGDSFTFQADNQFLIGSGGPLTLEVGSQCGTFNPASGAFLYTIPAQSAQRPLLSNPGGTSIANNGQGGFTIANINVTGSADALVVTGNLTGTAQPLGTTANPYNTFAGRYSSSTDGPSSVRLSSFSGDGKSGAQRGVTIDNVTGGLEITDTSIANMTRTGMLIQNNNSQVNTLTDPNRQLPAGYTNPAANNVAQWVTFNGQLTSTFDGAGDVASPILVIRNNAGNGNFDIATGNPPAGSVITTNAIADTGGEGILIQANAGATLPGAPGEVDNPGVKTDLGNISIIDSVDQGIYVLNDSSDLNIRSDTGQGIVRATSNGAAMLIANDIGSTAEPDVDYFGTMSTTALLGGTPGHLLEIVDIATENSVITLNGPGATPFEDVANGIRIERVGARDALDKRGTGANIGVSVTGARLASTGPTAIAIEGDLVAPTAATGTGTYSFTNISIENASNSGIQLSGLKATLAEVTFNNLDVNLTGPTTRGITILGGGTISIGGNSSITTVSQTEPVIGTFEGYAAAEISTLDFQFDSVTSSSTTLPVDNFPAGPYSAFWFQASSVKAGSTIVTGPFLNNGVQATGPNNVYNPDSAVTVTTDIGVISP